VVEPQVGDLIALVEFTPAALVNAIRIAGFAVELFESDVPMPTVPAAARALGVDQSRILKTLVFEDNNGQPLRVIASGPDRIDRKHLQEMVRTGRLELAPANKVLEFTGWPPGGVAPVGSRVPIPTFLDNRVLEMDWVYGGGGTEWTLIGLAPRDIVTITRATLISLTR
jgi:Cys-tRNA(Pro) deacylase